MKNVKFPLLIAASTWASMPFLTDDALTVKQNEFEVELATMIHQDSAAPWFAVTHGITPYLDFGFTQYHERLPWEDHHFNGHQFSAKFSLYPGHLAVSTTSDVLNGVTLLSMQGQHSFGKLDLIGNLNAFIDAKENEPDYGLLAQYNFEKFTLGTEVHGLMSELPKIQAGFQWYPMDWVSVQVGVMQALEEQHTHFTTGLVFYIAPTQKAD